MNNKILRIKHQPDQSAAFQSIENEKIHIHGRIFLSLSTAQSSTANTLKPRSLIEIVPICMSRFGEELDPSNEYLPISLEHIRRFYDMMQAALQTKPVTSNVLLCTGLSPYTQFGTLFLLGCYLVLLEVELCDAVTSLMDLDYVTSTFKCHGLSAVDFWRCLDRIRRMGWINFEAEDEMSSDSSLIDIEEFVHYAR